MTASGRTKSTTGPTSLMEKARLSGQWDDENNLVYSASWLTGDIDISAIRDAWWRVCLRHDALRRNYKSEDEACTHPDALVDVEFYTAESDEEAIEMMRRVIGVPFKLDGLGLARVIFIQRSERRHLFGVVIDHIIIDEISWYGLMQEFTEFYERALVGDAGEIEGASSYQSFAALQRREFSGAWGEERRAFWTAYIEEFGAHPPGFSAGRISHAEPSTKVAHYNLAEDVVPKVREFARRARVTPFSLLAAGVLVGMREVSGDPVVGLSISHHGRVLPGTAQTVGLFTQTMPLHLKGGSGLPLETAQEVFRRSLDVFEYILPLRVSGKYWNKTFMPHGLEPGVHIILKEPFPFSGSFVPIFGTSPEYLKLEVPGGRKWNETVFVEWDMRDTGSKLTAYYNENFISSATVHRLQKAAERFVLSEDD